MTVGGEYTPFTDEVEAMYVRVENYPREELLRRREFERWLNRIKGEAWDEGVRAAFNESIEFDSWVPYGLKNPYRTDYE